MKILKLKFKGIDSWNRPIFKEINGTRYFGIIDKLFGYDEEKKAIEYAKENTEQIVYFGNKFDCEPLGLKIKKEIKIEIEE